ncbi:MAG: restriction endonuclease PLD domain-containing protein, partial [Paraclostridium sp.]
DADELLIITGYTGVDIINELKDLPYKKITLVVGMYGRNIHSRLHNSILKSNTNITNLTVYYTNEQVHTKLYAWYKQGDLCDLLIGSANFSANALIERPLREILYQIKERKSEQQFKEYIDQIYSNMYSCTNLKPNKKDNGLDVDEIQYSGKICKLSLLSSGDGAENIIGIKTLKDEVQSGAGLNWGYSSGEPSIEDAYVKISKKNIKEAPILFPAKSKDEKQAIDVLWDDEKTMLLSLEANNGKEIAKGVYYPKQVASYGDKSVLGIYLRKRIGDKIGKDLIHSDYAINRLKEIKRSHKAKKGKDKKIAILEDIKKDKKLEIELNQKYITLDDLQKYGRTDITIGLLDDGTYYLDFSV